MVALATVDDLEARTGLTLTQARAEALLDDASARVRSYTGQQFTSDTTTDRLRVRNGRVRLPQRPVTAVTSVLDLNAVAVTYTRVNDIVVLDAGVPDTWAWEPRTTGLLYVDVTYEHGYEDDEIPDIIVAVVCQIAGRAYGSPSSDSGVQSESLGSYSYALGAAAGAGPLGLLADERAALDPFRRDLSMALFAPP